MSRASRPAIFSSRLTALELALDAPDNIAVAKGSALPGDTQLDGSASLALAVAVQATTCIGLSGKAVGLGIGFDELSSQPRKGAAR